MRKLDRLMAIVMALQHRPETAQSLADKLEVSKRTIIRDMQALSEMGVPIYSLPGPQGGYRLMEGYKLPPLHLTSDEALVVMFALNAMTKIADTPFNQARWTALDKIRAILPEQTLHEIEPLLTRLELDIPSREYSIPHLETIVRHAAASRWVRVYYRSENRQRWLHLKPKRVYMAHGFWYTEAYSLEHRETRTFRIDRMLESWRSRRARSRSKRKHRPQSQAAISASEQHSLTEERCSPNKTAISGSRSSKSVMISGCLISCVL